MSFMVENCSVQIFNTRAHKIDKIIYELAHGADIKNNKIELNFVA